MTTITNITDDHFDGGKNLTPGQQKTGDPTLADLIQAARVDVLAAEARLDILETFMGALDIKASVRLCTAGALAAYTGSGTGATRKLTANAVGAETIDGQAVALGDRVLVNNDGTATAKDRGIYTVTTVGDGSHAQVLTRASDADTSAKVTGGMYVRVNEGTANADTGWLLTTNDPIVLDTDALSFTAWGKYGTTAELADVAITESAGTSALVAHADHAHALGTGVVKRGTSNAGGAGDVAVAFPVAFGDANYKVALGNIGAADAVIKVGTIAAGGFTLTFGAAGDCHWIAIHD